MKCPKCNYENIKGAKVCGKCKTPLKGSKKSCPRCAFKNDIEDKKCQKCGYSFEKHSSIIFNFFISGIIVLILYSLLLLDKKDIVQQITFIFKIIAILTVIFIVFHTLYFSKKNSLNLNKDLYTNARIKKMEIFSKILLFILAIMLLCLSVYVYFKYIK